MKNIKERINNYIESKHEDYILEIMSIALGWLFVIGLVILLGASLSRNLELAVAGIAFMAATSAWERIMCYLTWREEGEGSYPNADEGLD